MPTLFQISRRSLLAACLLGCACSAAGVDFNRDIRPILSQHCFSCHGFDEGTRKAGLRLDKREGALAKTESGAVAVVPGHPEKSELISRIETADSDDLMPPVKHEKPLNGTQRALLKQWVTEGALYARHWAFEPPRKSVPEKVVEPNKQRSMIDTFVLERLRSESLPLSPEADKATLLRRVTLDLTGLPPTLAELDAFLADESPNAYERAVDRLLASPRFGERMAVDWLDAARYADTNGYFGDKTRSAWPWRQWVIEAFNQNMPFDQFTIEQLAGDLLPSPTRDQLIATGFHRNSMANNESGIIDEEYRIEAVVDRLDATATTWMGLTVGCAQCHDHKFDPISQKEYYQLFAFFNSTPEKGLVKDDSPPPVIEVPSPAQVQALEKSNEALSRAEAAFAPLRTQLQKDMAAWEATAAAGLAHPVQEKALARFSFEKSSHDGAFREAGQGTLLHNAGVLGESGGYDGTKHVEGPRDLPLEATTPWALALWMKNTGSLSGVWSKVQPDGDRRGVEMIWQKGKILVNLVHRWGSDAIELATRDPLPGKGWRHVILNCDGSGTAAGISLMVDGEAVALQINRDTLTGSIRNDEPLRLGRRDSGLGFYGDLDELWVLPRTVSAQEANRWFESERFRGILAVPAGKRPAADAKLLMNHFVDRHAATNMRTAYRKVERAKEELAALRAAIPTALVMQDLEKPRATHILMRGVYDQPGAEVTPDVPAAMGDFPQGARRNRLGLARWLVSSRNPLTARVAVNRLWQQCFGEGLVRTVADFGSQGELPTHPELLDWLAVDFMENGWNVKGLLRQIVTSATYRQSSKATPELLQRDPENRLLARGPRFRMPAEMLRDQSLAAAGLLQYELGGPSVKPYQPPGLWEAVSYNGDETYEMDDGAGQWRRSLYTFWKRQAPPPATLAFDGPTREKCAIRRPRTNTPLQALVLLNDETYIAAAAALAGAVLADPGNDATRISRMFRSVTSRSPEPGEVALLNDLLQKQRYRFSDDDTATTQLKAQGAEHAAWTVLAHTLLNLDETITRR